ncbi:MAG: Holliday junction resolvase-like protein [Candidatus Hydrothermarchaeales archaeon]
MIEERVFLYFLFGAGLIVVLQYLFYKGRIRALKEDVRDLKSRMKSGEVRFGKSWENFLPLMNVFRKRHDPGNFRFIGSPIDGISFDEDEIVFIEIKSGKSNLSTRQRNVKRLVKQKKIRWEEYKEKDLG